MTATISKPIQALIFDWAGTTIDHGSRAPVEVFVEVFRRQGIDLTTAEARGPMGMSKREHIAALLNLPRVVEAWRTSKGKDPAEADINRLYDDFLPLQRETIARHSQVIAGVPEVIAECRRRGLKIGSTTGYTHSLMEVAAPIAREQGFNPDVIVCSDDVPKGRPAPWMIFRAAEQLGVYPMSTVVVVDDTLVGIEAGWNAGAWTVGVTRTGNALGLSEADLAQLDEADRQTRLAAATAHFREAGAHQVIESVADLLPVLDTLANRQ
ncbi:phosphonoacetaldehyde hydrolase [soil metagenome]